MVTYTPNLENIVAVVTGGSRGIGFLIASALVKQGAKVVISSRSKSSAEKAAQKLIELSGGQVLGVACDVKNLQDIEQVANKTLEHFGQLDVWFNNAGITGPYAKTADVPMERWFEVIETNLRGTYYGTMVALKQMLNKNQGKIINLFGAGDVDSENMQHEYQSAYATSKAAIRRFTLVIANEYKHTNVSILGFNPGLVPTEQTTQVDLLTPDAVEWSKGLTMALEHIATPPEEIQQMAVYVASEATNGVTGETYRLGASAE
jgi:NAD(P)-dependent dehydrogenase (short-subunit alcohol dehydrogenase family)